MQQFFSHLFLLYSIASLAACSASMIPPLVQRSFKSPAGRTLFINISFICAAVNLGKYARNIAATPLTTGVAILVPCDTIYLLPTATEVISSPGAIHVYFFGSIVGEFAWLSFLV